MYVRIFFSLFQRLINIYREGCLALFARKDDFNEKESIKGCSIRYFLYLAVL